MTVQHLQETGIGRTVNSLRKDDGEVGVAAKALVTKWKSMVAAEESTDNDEKPDEDNETEEGMQNTFLMIKLLLLNKFIYLGLSVNFKLYIFGIFC